MNARERFLAVMNFEPADRTLLWDVGYWAGAVRRWYTEGLPHRVGISDDVADGQSIWAEFMIGYPEDPRRDFDIHEYMGMEEPLYRIPLSVWFEPAFEEEILEDHGEWVVRRDEDGIVMRHRKDWVGFPSYVGGPVGSKEDWESLKAERLRPTLEDRLPKNWLELVEGFRNRSYPLCIGGYPVGFYGAARLLLGQERVLTTFYDEPDLIRDIMSYLADFHIALFDQVLDQVDADEFFIWEDMCFKNGPLISPAMFREFMLPNYRKLTACLRDHGVGVIMVDTDGDARKLIPLFMEGGVNMLLPCEVNAGMDVVELRESFPELRLLGGIDKTKIADGPGAIDEELGRKIPFMLERGGYIPTVDHQVPLDVSWENFKYYRERLNAMIIGKEV